MIASSRDGLGFASLAARRARRWALLLACSAGLCAGTGAPPAAAADTNAVQDAIRRGVGFLLADQNSDGSWGSATRTKDLNIFAPIPGAHHAFRSGVTALAVEALLETGGPEPRPEVRQAIDQGETWLLEHLPALRRADPVAIYNVWAHGYGIQALVDLWKRAQGDETKRDRIRAVIAGQIELLTRYESVDGGWGYYDFDVRSKQPASATTSFTTATVLIAFDEARKTAGASIPERLAQRAVDSVKRQRKSDHSYLYGEYLRMRPMMGINRPAGSLGRSHACNLALRLWGDTNVTDRVMTDWLQRLVDRGDWLSIGRKRPIPHESWFQVAGYFFYYGYYYAARCVEFLGPEARARFGDRLCDTILPLQETDGSWWDFPLYDYHQPYGTAFALMTLIRSKGVSAHD
jgi:hypothetical protein